MWRERVVGFFRHLIKERLSETAFAVVALAVLFGAVAQIFWSRHSCCWSLYGGLAVIPVLGLVLFGVADRHP